MGKEGQDIAKKRSEDCEKNYLIMMHALRLWKNPGIYQKLDAEKINFGLDPELITLLKCPNFLKL